MATTAPDMDQPLDIREHLVRIDKTQVELQKAQAEIVKIKVDTRIAPFTVALTGAGAAAALIAATIRLTKLFLG